MSLDFGRVNRSVAFYRTTAFPLDARAYFESYKDAEAAAKRAEAMGSTNTSYYYGMKLLVYEDGVSTWYQISTDKKLIPEANTTSHLPQIVETEAEMNEILSNATEASIGTIYKFTGSSNTYEQGALYIISDEIPDGDEERY
jgi:hypothetical protein